MSTHPPDHSRSHFALSLLAWTLLVLGALWVNWRDADDKAHALAYREAVAHISKDLTFRLWVTSHGGLYVPPDEQTPPNPYLKIPNRDVETTTGKRLTLMNPAYVLRQIQQQYGGSFGVRSHITSLRPLNPGNAPDAWEAEALRAFEQGAEEYSAVRELEGRPHSRVMRAMKTESGCLKCHGDQGYRVGDVRGGVSASVDLSPYLAESGKTMRLSAMIHGGIWLAGFCAIGVYTRRNRLNWMESAQSERRLRESEERFRSVVETAPDAIVLADEGGTIVGWNQGAQHLFGYSRDEILGRPLTWLMPIRHRVSHIKGLERLRAGGSSRLLGKTVVIEGLRRDGGEFPIEFVLGGWSTLTGCYFSAVIRDITERKRTEAELDQYRHDLEGRVAERTRELEIAKDAAESANRAKSVFLSNMSHELRTPLNAILGFAQLMESDPTLAEPHRRELNTIHRSGRHLLALINDVLEISRIEAGRTEIRNEVFDLAEALSAIEEMIRIRAEQRGLAFRIERQGELPRHVHGDAHHLRQILINLLGNAVKYTDRGHISLMLTPLGEDMIRFEVADTGTGIAQEDLPCIFQAFYQTEAGIAKGEGTGLGLTISREFVRLMGGELRVASEPGRGSRFFFTLPLPEEMAPILSTFGKGRIVGLTPGQPQRRVLVAEDHADNREMICRLLENLGFEVRAVADGRSAVECFRNWRPDFIWMDMRMPVMDGYEATRAIRAMAAEGGKEVKIVALTASAFREDRDAILAAGCDDLLAKPIDAARLFRLMGELLGLDYRYAESDPAVPAAAVRDTILNLDGLDQDLRTAIRQAAEELDMQAFAEIVERLRPIRPGVVPLLEALVREFRFEQIQEAVRTVPAPDGPPPQT